MSCSLLAKMAVISKKCRQEGPGGLRKVLCVLIIGTAVLGVPMCSGDGENSASAPVTEELKWGSLTAATKIDTILRRKIILGDMSVGTKRSILARKKKTPQVRAGPVYGNKESFQIADDESVVTEVGMVHGSVRTHTTPKSTSRTQSSKPRATPASDTAVTLVVTSLVWDYSGAVAEAESDSLTEEEKAKFESLFPERVQYNFVRLHILYCDQNNLNYVDSRVQFKTFKEPILDDSKGRFKSLKEPVMRKWSLITEWQISVFEYNEVENHVKIEAQGRVLSFKRNSHP